MANKPRASSGFAQHEIDKAEKQLDSFEESLKKAADTRDEVSLKEEEPQTQMSKKELNNDAPYIRPAKTISSKEPFNEKYRKEYEHAQEFVKCIVEHKEIIGAEVEFWLRLFAGEPCKYYKVPTNRPVYLPRCVANHLSKLFYTKFIVDKDKPDRNSEHMDDFGALVASHKQQRISCVPAVTASF